MRPTTSMIFGFNNAICRSRKGMHSAASAGFGSRLPGGRHFKTFAMYTCSRGKPMASSMELSNCPARPTNGSPLRSSSAPGASPTMSQSAVGLPTPNTVWVRVALKLQRVHAATRARSSWQFVPASRDAGKGGIETAASGRPVLSRSVHDLRPSAARYSCRNGLFMRGGYRAAPAAQLAVHPDRGRGERIEAENHQQTDRQMQENQDERQGHEHDVGVAHLRARVDILEAIEGETADHQRTGARGHNKRRNHPRHPVVVLSAGEPYQRGHDGRGGRARQSFEV